MGMYTQVRGWLNVDSIGDYHGNSFSEITSKLHTAKEEFIESQVTTRSWVANDTVAHRGANGSAYIFFGTELKNYADDAESWIKFLITYFHNAEGRIDFQYEAEDWKNGDESKYWLIRGGEVIEEGRCKTWCNGYGNSFE